jgi:branched-chain amino acid transport system ATP-binding protein
MAEPLLTVENLHVFYDSIHALQGISLEVRKDEIVTLIGANGAGKSTTLRTISGLVPIGRGVITFDGVGIGDRKPHAIARLGISHVPEGRRVFGELTVRENLTLGAYARSDRQAIERSMEHVYSRFPRLQERRHQVAGTLSGGEQQMLAIGRGLMSDPKLLLLDEPSMGLAPMLIDEIYNIIEDISQSGTTILLVEQNAEMALSVATRGYLLETGSIVLGADSEDLITAPAVKESYLGHVVET